MDSFVFALDTTMPVFWSFYWVGFYAVSAS